MLTADDIHDRVRLRPFRPVRLVTSSGESYDIYHPDLIMVGRREVTVGIPIGRPQPITIGKRALPSCTLRRCTICPSLLPRRVTDRVDGAFSRRHKRIRPHLVSDRGDGSVSGIHHGVGR
jgi:hypothetical protein